MINDANSEYDGTRDDQRGQQTESCPGQYGHALNRQQANIDDEFGWAVAVSEDGTTAIVGTRSEDSDGDTVGKAYVYDLTTSPPTETTLTASDARDEDRFGDAVAVNRDGSTVVVGAPRAASDGSQAGTVYVYDLTTSPPTETTLTAGDARSDNYPMLEDLNRTT